MVLQNNPSVQKANLGAEFFFGLRNIKKHDKMLCYIKKMFVINIWFVLKTSNAIEKHDFVKIGLMAMCGGALHWATYCCLKKTNCRGDFWF